MKIWKKDVDQLSEVEDGYVAKIGDKYVFLSEEAALVWRLSENTHDIRGIMDYLSASYSDISESKIVDLLKTLRSHGLIEVKGEEDGFLEASGERGSFRPVKKLQILGRKKIIGTIRVLEPLLGFLTQDKWIAACYIVPWIAFGSFIIYARLNPFVQIAFMNYAAVVFLLPILLLHELAHAVVSEKLGAKVGGFGIGIYQIIPFFYTDTSETLLLRRKDRIKVSAAGPAVNFIFGLVFVILSLFFGNMSLFALSSILFLLGLNSLVPAFESDGYYAMLDYGRINDPNREAFSFIRSLRGKSQNLERRKKLVLSLYVLSYAYTIVVIAYFCLFFLPVYVAREMHDMQSLSSLGVFELASFAFGLLYLAMLLLVGASFVNRELRQPRRRWGQDQDS
jgi:putative peptide zinc metalloprotease protein